MIKAIFFDIDGTLITREGKVLDTTKEAIKLAKKKGIICGIATGRGPTKIVKEILDLNLDVFVTYNGQLIYTENETIYANAFSKKTLNELVSFCSTNKRQILFGSETKLDGSKIMNLGRKSWLTKIVHFIPKTLSSYLLALRQRWFTPKKSYSYQDLAILKEPIFQCILLSPEKETDALKKQFQDCHFTRSNPYTVDIIPSGGSKLNGLKQITDYYEFSLDQIMVFGDSWNDLEMLAGAGIGVAMGNGSQEAKRTADFVTKTNESDGIDYALRHFDII